MTKVDSLKSIVKDCIVFLYIICVAPFLTLLLTPSFHERKILRISLFFQFKCGNWHAVVQLANSLSL